MLLFQNKLVTFHGFPGSNSGTKSLNAVAAAGDGCDEGHSLCSDSAGASGQPSLTLRPDDHVLENMNVVYILQIIPLYLIDLLCNQDRTID